MACVDLCPHHITRESSWRSGGAHERGKDEDHRPRAVPPSRAWRARAALRPRQYSAWHVCRVVAGGGREPEQDGWSQVAVWRHRPASRSPRGLCLSERRVGWVPVCARGVRGEACWRPGTTRTVAGPTAQDPRMLITTLSSEVRGQRCTRPYPWTVSHRESNFNSFKVTPLPLTPHRLTIALGAGSQRLNSQWAPSSSSPRRHARRGSRQDTMQRPRPRRRQPAPRGDPCPAAPLPLRKGPCALLQLGLLGSR